MGGIELVRNKSTKEAVDPTLAVAPYAIKRAQEHGLITRSLGQTLAHFKLSTVINVVDFLYPGARDKGRRGTPYAVRRLDGQNHDRSQIGENEEGEDHKQ